MKVLHVIKSPSFKSDGRLQKWVSKLSSYEIFSDVLIVEDDNSENTEDFNSTKIIRKPLKFRKYFEKRKGYLFKIPEYYFLTKKFLVKKDYELIVFHDVQQYFNLYALLRIIKRSKAKIIWDLHELPHEFLFNYSLTRSFIRLILNQVNAVVYTNVERRAYILSKIKGIKEKNFFILNNFPNKEFIESPDSKIDIPGLTSKPYFLWLGAGVKGRNFQYFLNSYLNFKDSYNLVIIGKVSSEFQIIIDQLTSEGKVYNKFVDQNEIINYIDGAFLSVVLYKSDSANNFYCEPNRLYQLLSRRIPVVVGNNPTMGSLIKNLDVGEVLNDDGSDEKELTFKIQKVIARHSILKDNLNKIDFTKVFSWENQMDKIVQQIQNI